MNWFAVRDEDGKYWDFDGMDDYRNTLSATNRGRKWAEEVKAHTGGSKIIEVVDAPSKVVVSEEEAKMLKKAKDTTVWRPASVIAGYAYENTKDPDDEALLEDRLMCAYVNGWNVEKLKRYVLPMEGTKLADGTIAYATLNHTGVWTIKGYSKKQSAVAFHNTITQAEIDAAPDWVKAIKPVEVTDDEQ